MKAVLLMTAISMVGFLGSCKKEALDTDQNVKEAPQKIYYNGQKYEIKTTLDEKGEFTTEYMPDELKEFFKDSEKPTVTHVIMNENETLVCLYDTEKDFKEHVTFESSQAPGSKSLNGATIKTYSGGWSEYVVTGHRNGEPIYTPIDFTRGTLLRTSTNSTWGTYHFNSNSGYGYSLPWVGNAENDKIQSIQFIRVPSSEHTQFMGCKHITWGGSKLWVTNHFQTSMALNLNRINFGNSISSYEYFQANVAFHNLNF